METDSRAIHEHWSSRRGFLLAAIGSAVGLGNIWRFPYITGVNGGGAFVIIYCLSITIIGLPLLMAEIAIGRRGGGSAIYSMRRLAEEGGNHRLWRVIGWQAVLAPTLGLMYYSVVAGWTLGYARTSITGGFGGLDAQGSARLFETMSGSPGRSAFWLLLFLAITTAIVTAGVRKGLERSVKLMVPGLGAILLLLVVYAASTADFAGALRFMFRPDFGKVTPAVVLMAIGQAFFSVNVATGAMITYGAYMPQQVSIPRVALTVAIADTAVAVLMGLVIFPLVLSYGLEAAEGPGLVFVTLPIAFGQMPAGALFGTLFFLFMAIAALTSAIGMLEPAVSWLEEHHGFGRRRMALVTGAFIGLGAVAASFSFNRWSDFFPLGSARTVFDLMDFTTANLLIPLGGLLLALFAGWAMLRRSQEQELELPGGWLRLWRFLVGVVAPVAIALVFVANIVGA